MKPNTPIEAIKHRNNTLECICLNLPDRNPKEIRNVFNLYWDAATERFGSSLDYIEFGNSELFPDARWLQRRYEDAAKYFVEIYGIKTEIAVAKTKRFYDETR